MHSFDYDVITVGGGLAGSSLAIAMAKAGSRVLVIEREGKFRDRVRGEQMTSWGVGEARELGVEQLLLNNSCGREIRWWRMYFGPLALEPRDCIETTPQRAPQFMFYHPAMQAILLQAAADAGAKVYREGAVREVKPGPVPAVVVERNGRVEELSGRLIVGADGRSSVVRKWAGFTVNRDEPRRLIAGALLDNMHGVADDELHLHLDPDRGRVVLLAPQGQGRVRAYLVYPHASGHRLQGQADYASFIEESIRTTNAPEYYAGVELAGPLASFDGADTWVEHPYRQGVALIGDAAASNDPSFGQGLSLTLRDVRVLRDQLLSSNDWSAAAEAYAEEHDSHYGVIHQASRCFGQMFYDASEASRQLRARALPLIVQDPTRVPDQLVSGPEVPLDETAIRRFFGEE